ncbi:hypothetical protein Hanom_Chr14g01334941 [Helianthus anomalus]
MSKWYAKRFLHPDIVATYDYTFIWDDDLGVEHFNADKYIQLVKKHGLEISQPGLEPNNGLTWQMTKWGGDKELHKVHEEKQGWCSDPHLPPYVAFVEIMAPVFSRAAWRCVWHMIQVNLHFNYQYYMVEWLLVDVVPNVIKVRKAPGSLYRSPVLYAKLLHEMDVDNSSSDAVSCF